MSSMEYLLLTEDEIAKELAIQAKDLRVSKNLTQKAFAEKSGIAHMTYCKFERTGKISLIGFLKVLRHLGRLQNISTLLEMSSIENIGLERYADSINRGKKRERASKSGCQTPL